jgi:hypothetical protein
MYKTILVITYSKLNFFDKLKKILKGINYDITKKDYKFDIRNKKILYAVFNIETFHNIRNILTKNFEKEFIKYPDEIYRIIESFEKKKINMYYILSKLKDNNNFYFIRTEYSSKINPKILW